MNLTHKIALISFTYNEEKFIPFVIDYWKRFVSHAYVFDNGYDFNLDEQIDDYFRRNRFSIKKLRLMEKTYNDYKDKIKQN